MNRAWVLLIYPASALGFGAVVACSPSTHPWVTVGLLVIACFGTLVYLGSFVMLVRHSLEEKRMMAQYPEIPDVVRKHRLKYHPELPDEDDLRRAMTQTKLMLITSGLVFFCSVIWLIFRLL